jgi:hypothetical protein
VKVLHTIEIGVDSVLLKIAVLNHLNLDGRQQVIRKNLLVIVVVLDHVMLVSCWYTMWMEINTTLGFAI